MGEFVGEYSGAGGMVTAASELLTRKLDLSLVHEFLTEAEIKAFLEIKGSGPDFRTEAERLWYKTLPQDEVNAAVKNLWPEHGTLDTSIGDLFIESRRQSKKKIDGQTIHVDNQNGIHYVAVLEEGCESGAELIDVPDRLPALQEYDAINRQLARRFPRAGRKDLPNFGVNALRSSATLRRGDLAMFSDRAMHAVNIWPGRVVWIGSHVVNLLHGRPQPV